MIPALLTEIDRNLQVTYWALGIDRPHTHWATARRITMVALGAVLPLMALLAIDFIIYLKDRLIGVQPPPRQRREPGVEGGEERQGRQGGVLPAFLNPFL